MKDLVNSLKSSYRERRRTLDENFLEAQEVDEYLISHTRLVDQLIEEVAGTQLDELEFAVIATAGYGRQEQFPRSDVDLLIVPDSRDDARIEAVIGRFLHALWDLHLLLGHQVWRLSELEELTLDQYEFVFALFDARYVAGSRRIAEHVISDLIPEFIAANRDGILERVSRSTTERHKKFQDTIYQLEPDLKEAPGALRDHLAARWLERLLAEVPFRPYSDSEIRSAHRFIQRLRILLHLLVNRTDNRLTHQHQETLLPCVASSEANTQSGVESLMKEYFLNARVIYRYCSSMLNAAAPDSEYPEIRREEVAALGSIAEVLELFERSLTSGTPLSDGARSELIDKLPELTDTLHFPSLRPLLKRLLTPREGLYRVLSDLYELGVLELLFPEFGTIKARVIRDFYHKYTVDEHTLIAIKSIEDLIAKEGEGSDGRFQSILADTVVPYHLILALLLHDVGKSRGGKHSDESARMAARAMRRFRFGAEEINAVVFLIRHHLAMSAVIFRRDLEDEEVVRRFSNLVEGSEKLRLLTLLTYADIKAVAPGTLNDWKKDLLWQLYLQTYRKLTLGYGDERIHEEDIGARLRKGLPDEMNPHEFERFLEGFPTRYLTTTAPQEIYQHFQLASRLEEDPVQTQLTRRKTHYELCIITPDRSRIFSKIVGVLSYFEMNILKGYGFANEDETILDFFEFFDSREGFRHSLERERFRNLLEKALNDEVSVEDLLREKEESIFHQKVTTPGFSPTVYFEEEVSKQYTIMEIVAPDSLGLLYRISREIADLDCDIDLALISTEGEKAVDVFYLAHQGGKLSSELRQRLADQIVTSISN